MRRHAKNFISHPLITGSSVIFLGSIFANLFHFLFNLFMSRNLSISDYGTLISIISLTSVPTLLAGAVGPTVLQFAGTYFAKNEYDKIRGLFLKTFLFCSIIGVLLFSIFLFFSLPISAFFHITNSNIVPLAGLFIFINYVGVINSSLLQAKLAFTFISFTNFLMALSKLILGYTFVTGGLGVVGGLWSYIISYSLPYVLSYIPLRFLFARKITIPHISNLSLIAYGTPAAFAQIGMTCLTTFDVILVKHFFTPELAGMYAGMSLIGRVIFFVTAPIVSVMFPLIVQRHAKKEIYHSVFLLSFILVLIPSLFMTIFYFIFPEFVITLFLKQKEYLYVAKYLGYFGIFITIYAILSVLINFFLSIKKTLVSIPVIVVAILQIIGIWLFHNSFAQVLQISIFLTSLLLVMLLLYYWKIYGTTSIISSTKKQKI